MLRLQRQGRLGFYLSSLGRGGDAHRRGARAAPRRLAVPGVPRGRAPRFTAATRCARSCASCSATPHDPVKGRQMPVHHSIRSLNFVSISSPVATQIPHAVGTAWAAKLQKKDDVAAAFFGEGGTSTPIFHTSLNFAGVFKAPAILICRNNGWAISVPRSVQTATPTFAQKAIAYGMPGVLRRRQRHPGDDSRHRRGGGARAARRGRDADRGAHLPARRAQLVGRPVGLPRPGRAQGVGAPRPARALPQVPARARTRSAPSSRRRCGARSSRRSPTRSSTRSARRPSRPCTRMFEDVYADVPWHLREQQPKLGRRDREARPPKDWPRPD